MAYDNTNSGFLGKNTRKETDKHPDITGHINIEGKDYWLSGWKNAKGYGLRAKPKDEQQNQDGGRVGGMSEDIPF